MAGNIFPLFVVQHPETTGLNSPKAPIVIGADVNADANGVVSGGRRRNSGGMVSFLPCSIGVK